MIPWIALVARVRQRIAETRRVVRRQVADREYRSVGRNRSTVGQRHRRPLPRLAHIGDVAVDQIQPIARPRQRLVQLFAQVIAVSHALNKGRTGIAAPVRRQPADEMVGVVGQRAHVAGADVEDVVWPRRAVRQSLAGFGGALDQGRARAVVAQQVDRLQCPRKSRADDRDMPDHGLKSRIRVANRVR